VASRQHEGPLRQRHNLGRTRIWGVQTDVEYLVCSF
jgi:hypothetical protein